MRMRCAAATAVIMPSIATAIYMRVMRASRVKVCNAALRRAYPKIRLLSVVLKYVAVVA